MIEHHAHEEDLELERARSASLHGELVREPARCADPSRSLRREFDERTETMRREFVERMEVTRRELADQMSADRMAQFKKQGRLDRRLAKVEGTRATREIEEEPVRRDWRGNGPRGRVKRSR
jgi:hypothetical protein